MKKIITVTLTGDISLLENHLVLTDKIVQKKINPNKTRLIYSDETIVQFDDLERVINDFGLDISLTVIFRSYDFDKEECINAPLLILQPECVDGVGLTEEWLGVIEMQNKDQIEMFSYSPLDKWFISTCGSQLLLHQNLVEKLREKDLVTGLNFKPILMTFDDETISHDWFWAYTTIDLGKPYTDRRFIKVFEKSAWKGEQFCTSSYYDYDIIFISQPVYQFFLSLPPKLMGDIKFEPIELSNLN